MTILLNNQPVNVSEGQNTIGPFDLPNGTTILKVTYECAAWPVVSDGTITVVFEVRNAVGQQFLNIWQDTFQHQQLRRGGVIQSTAQFSVGLPQPFPSTARAQVIVNTTVAFSTVVIVEAL